MFGLALLVFWRCDKFTKFYTVIKHIRTGNISLKMAKLPRNVRKSIFSKMLLTRRCFWIKILSSNNCLKFEIKGPTSIVLGCENYKDDYTKSIKLKMHRYQMNWLKTQTLAFRYSDRIEKQKFKLHFKINWILDILNVFSTWKNTISKYIIYIIFSILNICTCLVFSRFKFE